MDFKKEIDRYIIKNDNDEDSYLLDELSRRFDHKLFGNNLMVYQNNGDWVDFAFFKWQCGEAVSLEKSINNEGELIWYGSGPSGNLRELRHSYFPEYVFYANLDFMIECCNALKEFYD